MHDSNDLMFSDQGRLTSKMPHSVQAYDLEELREVAVKIHQLTASWSEAKKSSYVKHATREFNIHKSLQHPLIVALLDIFELDANSFATVLELCTGGDLDCHLKEHTVGTLQPFLWGLLHQMPLLRGVMNPNNLPPQERK